MKETPLFVPGLTQAVTESATILQAERLERFYQELRELVKKHDIKFAIPRVPNQQDLIDTAQHSHSLSDVLHILANEDKEGKCLSTVRSKVRPPIANTESNLRWVGHAYFRDEIVESPTEPSSKVVVTRLGRIMTQFKCSSEDAQRYIDYRDDGYSHHAAAVMAGIADPAE